MRTNVQGILRSAPFLLTPLLLAQIASEGSIHGIVTDAGTGAPLQDCRITVLRDRRQQASAVTDSDGRYLIANLAAGSYGLTARCAGREPTVSKSVNLAAGEGSTLNMQFQAPALISGRVVDENGKAAGGIDVQLISREYRWGALSYVHVTSTTADPEGRYAVSEGIVPGRSYFVLAVRPLQTVAVSKAPADPGQRPDFNPPTYYPTSTVPESALPLVLAPAEEREKVDIRLATSRSYCVTGTILIRGRPGSSNFSISTPSLVGPDLRAEAGAGPDGKFRVCDLAPGEYVFQASSRTGSTSSDGRSEFVVGNDDVHDLQVLSGEGAALRAEVVWDDPPPGGSHSHIQIVLASLTGQMAVVEFQVPFTGLLNALPSASLFAARATLPAGLYLKQMTYGGVDVLNQPISLARGIDTTLRIVIARDGGTLAVRVTNSNDEPVPDAVVSVIPARAATLPDVSALLTSGRADQYGAYRSGTLAPGKYLVLAGYREILPTPEDLGKFLNARSKATPVELGPNATAQVIVRPAPID